MEENGIHGPTNIWIGKPLNLNNTTWQTQAQANNGNEMSCWQSVNWIQLAQTGSNTFPKEVEVS